MKSPRYFLLSSCLLVVTSTASAEANDVDKVINKVAGSGKKQLLREAGKLLSKQSNPAGAAAPAGTPAAPAGTAAAPAGTAAAATKAATPATPAAPAATAAAPAGTPAAPAKQSLSDKLKDRAVKEGSKQASKYATKYANKYLKQGESSLGGLLK